MFDDLIKQDELKMIIRRRNQEKFASRRGLESSYLVAEPANDVISLRLVRGQRQIFDLNWN